MTLLFSARARFAALALVLAAPLFLIAAGGEKTATQIVDESYRHNLMDFDTATADMKMELIEHNKVVESRTLRSKALRVSEGVVHLRRVKMTFTAPGDISGTCFLNLEKGGGADDDQFLYLPAVGKALRKGGKSGRTESFMGTQFTFWDLESKDVNKSSHVRKPDETLNGVPCYVVESTPNPSSDDPYGKYISWIDQKTFIPIRAKMFDKQGQPWKVMMAEKVEKIDAKLMGLRQRLRTGGAIDFDVRQYFTANAESVVTN